MIKKLALSASVAALAIAVPSIAASYAEQQAASAQPTAGAKIEAKRMGSWGMDTAGMDKSVKPGDDFFAYSSGNWAKNTPIPSDRSSYSSFTLLTDLSEARLKNLVEGYKLGDPMKDGNQAKVAAIYQSFMDEAAVDALGSKPLQPAIDRIRAVASKEDMARLMGAGIGDFHGSFFDARVVDDPKNPAYYTLMLSQSGLGLGDRDMYLDSKFAPQKQRYQQYAAQLLGLAGWANPDKAAADLVALETRIAEGHWPRAESRDRDKTYNPMTLAELQRDAAGFPWAAFFNGAGVEKADKAVVSQKSAFPKIARAFAEADLDTLKAWQAFRTTDSAAAFLSKPFANAHFDFRSKFLAGQPEQRPRWKRGIHFAEESMGDAIGRDYAKLYFTAEAKAQMDELIRNMRAAMSKRIEGLTWMSPATKQQAKAKLAGFGVKIGHPEKWRDYSALEIRNGDLFGNIERAQKFEWDYRRNRVGQPVDKTEWRNDMNPQRVNAYYNATKNEIVFPAAILQPPFFDPKADPAINYGAVGGVIGHEISHGFDDQGRKSDGAGLLRDWWSPQDAAKFEAQAARLGAQYEAHNFEGLDGIRINGRNSMGENIGDLGGIHIAHEAYRMSLKGKKAPVIDGFTGDQRFFMGWAQVWRAKWRTEALRQQLVNGTHSPGQIRAFGPLRNTDAWYEAFNVKPGDKLYIPPEERVRIW